MESNILLVPLPLTFLFQLAVSIAVIPLATELLKYGSVSIPVPLPPDFLFQMAVSTAVIPFAMEALNCGSNSFIFPSNVSADLA